MTKYQFECPDSLWRKWKRTVPRDVNLDERIRQLLEADAEGRVIEASSEADESGRDVAESDPEGLREAVDFPGPEERVQDCLRAVYLARHYVHEHGGATKAELVVNVMEQQPAGYDVEGALEKIASGERYRGGWWRNVVKPGLEALPEIEAPTGGASEWRPSDAG